MNCTSSLKSSSDKIILHDISSLQWRHNGCDGISNHQPDDYLLNCVFRRRSKKTSKLRLTGFWSVNPPHKKLVMQKMFPFNDVNMFNSDTICSRMKSIQSDVIFTEISVISFTDKVNLVLGQRLVPSNLYYKCTLVCYKIVDNSDVIGASPVSAAPTTSSFST